MSRQKGSTFYGEEKTAALFAGLTPTALSALDRMIARYDKSISRSEFLERLGRKLLDQDKFNEVFFKES